MTWPLAEYAAEPAFARTAKVPERNPVIIRYTAVNAAREAAYALPAKAADSSTGNPPCGKRHCCYLTKTSIYHCPCKECHG